MAKLQDVADFFIDSAMKRNEEPMTNLRIQKMLYFAQAHHLQRHGTPLFEEDMKAWDLGPVVPTLYYYYSVYGGQPIMKVHSTFSLDSFTDDELETLIDVLHRYSKLKTSELVSLSHVQGGPWDVTAHNDPIKKEIIKQAFDKAPSLAYTVDDPNLFANIPVYECLSEDRTE